MRKGKRKQMLSAVKLVKANARERLGMPPPGGPIADRKSKQEHGPEKHRGETMAKLLREHGGEEA